MMINAIERILVVSEHLGIIEFFVDAQDDKAKRFYERFGFIPLTSSLRLFLPVTTLRTAFEKAIIE